MSKYVGEDTKESSKAYVCLMCCRIVVCFSRALPLNSPHTYLHLQGLFDAFCHNGQLWKRQQKTQPPFLLLDVPPGF